MKKLPIAIRVYLLFVYLVTFILLYVFFHQGYLKLSSINLLYLAFFSMLIALTESFPVIHKKMSFSTTFAVELAVFMVFGPFFALLATALGFSLRYVKDKDNKYKHIFNTPLYGTMFNYCVLILPLLMGSYAYLKLDGNFVFTGFGSNLLQITAFSMICFILNTLMISILLSISIKKNLLYTFFSNIKLVLINFIIMVPFGIMLAMIDRAFGYLGVLFLFFPIIMMRFTFSLYIDSKNQYIQTVDALMRAVEARDKYTEGHSQRVAVAVEMIARELKYSESRIDQLNMASLLHDVGKIGIDDNILNKPGKLTAAEYDEIKKHPEIGYNILKDVKNLGNVIDLVRHHHERYDGLGYPDGKNKDELAFDIFIIQLADAIDAMATDRPYRRALSEDEINDEIDKNSGTQFHPEVVKAYFNAKAKKG
ncbi:MAG: HD-GYP domain-containing protein [Solirubrobacterales bacterium]